ncbi:MAG: type II secretion system F family protein [Clostridiaceae bacterium]
MVTVLLVFSGLMIMLYILSRGKYSDIVDSIDKKACPIKGMLPVGLYMLDLFKYSYNTTYDRKLITAIKELHGPGKAVLMLRVHWGGKLSWMLLSLLFAFFVGTLSEPDAGYAIFCILLPVVIFYISDRELFEKVKKRRLAIQLDFPDFVNKLTLLINAGMTVSKAWERTSASDRQTPLYMELASSVQNIRSGMAEHKAYEEFAKRCHVPVITRFITVILQNIRKGNAELVPILRVFANECWEIRKNTAKKYGEEASTKMLLPMMLMFIAILLIVGMPAVLALKCI